MDINSYLGIRELISISAYPISILLLIVSSLLLLFSNIGSRLSKYCSILLYLEIGIIAVGYALLIILHLSIAQDLPLIEPYSGSLIGRFFIPPWIESERVLLWLLLVSVIALRILRNDRRYFGLVSIPIFLLTFFLVFVENPFKNPLPAFHGGYMDYISAVQANDSGAINESLRSLAGKMFGYYNSPYMWMHPPLLFLSYALFTVSSVFTYSFKVAFQEARMRIAYSQIKLGFLVLTIALLLGYPWALMAWKGLPWWWDPKVNSSILMWILYCSYLHTYLYYEKGRLRRLTTLTAMFSFAVMLFTFFSGYFLPGVHSSA